MSSTAAARPTYLQRWNGRGPRPACATAQQDRAQDHDQRRRQQRLDGWTGQGGRHAHQTSSRSQWFGLRLSGREARPDGALIVSAGNDSLRGADGHQQLRRGRREQRASTAAPAPTTSPRRCVREERSETRCCWHVIRTSTSTTSPTTATSANWTERPAPSTSRTSPASGEQTLVSNWAGTTARRPAAPTTCTVSDGGRRPPGSGGERLPLGRARGRRPGTTERATNGFVGGDGNDTMLQGPSPTPNDTFDGRGPGSISSLTSCAPLV